MRRILTAAAALLLWSHLAGVAVADDGVITLPPLQWPTIDDGNKKEPVEQPIARAQISWSSLAEFSSVAATDNVPYGALSLTARYLFDAAEVAREARVEWRLNGSENAVSVGDSVIDAGQTNLDNSITGGEAALPAGRYDVTYLIDGRLAAQGSTSIQAPPAIGDRKPEEVYAAALQVLVGALEVFQQQDLQKAGQLAAQALPGIASAMQAKPDLPDILAISEAAHALVALQNTDKAVNAANVPLATEWATRAATHAGMSDALVQDAQFKQWTTQLAADTMKLLEALLQVQAQAQG